MKKAIYLFAATALMTGCNQDVLVEQPQPQPEVDRHIGFDTFVDKATRTRGTNSNALNDFYPSFNVYGWKMVGNVTSPVFENVTVSYCNGVDKMPSAEWGQGAPAGWYYENIRYWDKMATSYQFSAYAPVAASAVVKCTKEGGITIGNAEAPITVEGTNLMAQPATTLAYTGFAYDYMTAQSTDKSADKVSLIFSHLQAKLNIRIRLDKDKVTTAQDVSVQKIQVHNLGDKAYYTNAANTGVSGWTLTTPSTDYVPKVETAYSLNNATQNYDGSYVLEQLIIPQTIAKSAVPSPSLNEYAEACVYVEYTIGSETFKSYSPLANIFIDNDSQETNYNLEGGKQYTINITIGPDPIELTAEVANWADAVEEDLIMD